MVDLEFGDLGQFPLIYLKHYSKMDVCHLCLIASMSNLAPTTHPTPPFNFFDMTELIYRIRLSWQQFNLKTVLNVTDYDVENQLLWTFLVRGGERRKK